MPPPRGLHLHAAFYLFLLPVILLLATRGPGAAASVLSTFALAKADATTIVCALLPSEASPQLVDLNCTAADDDHARQETYPSSHPFAALAGGEDFLCAVGPFGQNPGGVDMRWWDLSGSNNSRSKRVYMGPPLKALASGDYRVCGVLDSGELHCWRWRGLNISRDLRFVAAAVGDDFVCGILKGTPASIRCFDNDTMAVTEAVAGAPTGGSFDVVAACGRRACTLSMTGALKCWGLTSRRLPCRFQHSPREERISACRRSSATATRGGRGGERTGRRRGSEAEASGDAAGVLGRPVVLRLPDRPHDIDHALLRHDKAERRAVKRC